MINTEVIVMGRRDNGIGTIYYSEKRKYWFAEIQIGIKPNGKPNRKKFSAKTQREVKAKLKKYRENLQEHKSEAVAQQVAKENEGNDKTLTMLMIEWVQNAKKNKLKPESFQRLVGIIAQQITPRIGSYTISELNIDILQHELIDTMFEDGLSLSTIRKAKSALHDFMQYHIKREYMMTKVLQPNIIDLLEIPAKTKFQTKEIQWLSDNEVQEFLKVLHHKNKLGQYIYDSHYLIDLLLQTGLRLGELLGLKLEDYNRQNKTLTIRRNVVSKKEVEDYYGGTFKKEEQHIQESTKSSSGVRVIPLNEDAVNDLEQQIKQLDKWHIKSDFLAINRQGKLIWGSNLRKTIYRIYDNAGVNKKGVHTLRHTYASALFAQGIDLKIVSSLLGHGGIQITADTYVHVLNNLQYDYYKNQYKFKPYPKYLLERGVL